MVRLCLCTYATFAAAVHVRVYTSLVAGQGVGRGLMGWIFKVQFPVHCSSHPYPPCVILFVISGAWCGVVQWSRSPGCVGELKRQDKTPRRLYAFLFDVWSTDCGGRFSVNSRLNVTGGLLSRGVGLAVTELSDA